MADLNVENRLSPEGKVMLPSFEGGLANPETEKGPEQAGDRGRSAEQKQDSAKKRESFREALAKVPPSAPTAAASEQAKQIDAILEDGLGDIFLKMEPARQSRFKVEGEKSVAKIDLILSKAKVNAHRIFQIIKKWLALIPGINRFFLEQEAKIKTDKIMKIKR